MRSGTTQHEPGYSHRCLKGYLFHIHLSPPPTRCCRLVYPSPSRAAPRRCWSRIVRRVPLFASASPIPSAHSCNVKPLVRCPHHTSSASSTTRSRDRARPVATFCDATSESGSRASTPSLYSWTACAHSCSRLASRYLRSKPGLPPVKYTGAQRLRLRSLGSGLSTSLVPTMMARLSKQFGVAPVRQPHGTVVRP